MTCGPREKEGLELWGHRKFVNGFGARVFEHKRCRHRPRAGLHAPTRHIWCVANVYKIH